MASDLRKRVLNVSQRQGAFRVVWCTGCVPALEVAAQPGRRQARRRQGDRRAGLLRGGTNRLSRGLAARGDQDFGGHRVGVDDSHHGDPPDRLMSQRLGCLAHIVVYLSCQPACRRMEVGAGREGPARADASAPDPSEHGSTWD